MKASNLERKKLIKLSKKIVIEKRKELPQLFRET